MKSIIQHLDSTWQPHIAWPLEEITEERVISYELDKNSTTSKYRGSVKHLVVELGTRTEGKFDEFKLLDLQT